MANSEGRNLTIVPGGLYGTPRTAAERLQAAVQGRYAALKNRRGVTPGGPIYHAAAGITTPLSAITRHIALAKANRTEYGAVKQFARGVMRDVDEYVDALYGKTQGPERGSAA